MRVLIALEEWRDEADGTAEDKVESLLSVLSESDIAQNQLVEDLREHFDL